ncbi:hypothetical protein FQA39_LY15725 [Lamprigera yunnana]|nr:hypothetical protein FQA39_LY15725 [Lamprigera yunnana]
MKAFFLVGLLAVGAFCAPKSRQGKIVGGEAASPGQFPYQISLRYRGSHNCGGSIINPGTILTAAHCLDGFGKDFMTVVVGTNHVSEGGVEHSVLSAVFHAQYNALTVRHDIGLLKLDSEIAYNDNVKPIALETQHVGEDVDLVLSGWGKTSYPGNGAIDLQFIHLKSVSNEVCKGAHFFPPIFDTQICTFTKRGEGACHGDSGGPLASETAQVGIVSWGQPCAINYPDVFTRVSSYITWIEDHQ